MIICIGIAFARLNVAVYFKSIVNKRVKYIDVESYLKESFFLHRTNVCFHKIPIANHIYKFKTETSHLVSDSANLFAN